MNRICMKVILVQYTVRPGLNYCISAHQALMKEIDQISSTVKHAMNKDIAVGDVVYDPIWFAENFPIRFHADSC